MDLANADCLLIMGSNFAEAHPVGFRFVLKARERGAEVIHVDPRFTRTSAHATQYVQLRAGSDLVFLGALVRWVLDSERWWSDPFFREYVTHYTNAATIVGEEFEDVEELHGDFSGWDEETGRYDPTMWEYEGVERVVRVASRNGEPRYERLRTGQQMSARTGRTRGGPAPRDETLQDRRCVLQLLRRHFDRYTPEMVEEMCGVPRERFVAVAETLLRNSGRERTTAICYAVGWTQHTTGAQLIATAAILQLLLGNIGRPGGGIQALRGHATIQGSTDIPTLYDLLPGYLPMPAAAPLHETLDDYVWNEGAETGAWANTRAYLVSLLKAWFGEHATPENDFAYDLLPRITGDHSHMPMFLAMRRGEIEGLFLMGQNPAVGGQNARLQREALGKLKWLVVRDIFPIESATFWKDAPEVRSGDLRPEEIETEVFVLPAATVAEKDGSFTNTQRLIQWHEKAVDPPGDARSDAWFIHHLFKRLKRLYADSDAERDRPLHALRWEYPEVGPHGEPDVDVVLREINGVRETQDGAVPLRSAAELCDDGSTSCGCWIYCGVHTGTNRAASRDRGDGYVAPGWGFAWPNNVRMLYNRCSADPAGRPWSERKRYVWWDEAAGRWTGLDQPDFPADKRPDHPGATAAGGLAALAGDAPFVLKPDGRAWLYFPFGMKDGPLPTHYEPWETPVPNLLHPERQRNPAAKRWNVEGNPYHAPEDPAFPYVLTTYRLTEHHTGGGMTRFNAWLAELQPRAFVEISPELAAEHGVRTGDWVTVTTARGAVEARALVTRRLRPLRVAGRIVHQVGFPWHFGYEGLATGAAANDLVALVGEPNVTIHEAKVLTCNLRAGRLGEGRR